MDSSDLIVKITLQTAVQGRKKMPPPGWAQTFDTLLTAIIKTSPAERAAAYTVALQWFELTLPERTPQTNNNDYNNLVITQWDNLKMLLNAIAQQQSEPNRDWAAKFDTFVQKRYLVTGDGHIQKRAAAYTVALQWFGVPLPERTADDYNTRVTQKWKELRTQRDIAMRVDCVILLLQSLNSYEPNELAELKEDLIEATEYIKNPAKNVYRASCYDAKDNIVKTLVEELHKAFYRESLSAAEDAERLRVTNLMLDCWVALVERPDYVSSVPLGGRGGGRRRRTVLLLDGLPFNGTVMCYVVGYLQTMINGVVRRELGENNINETFNKVWQKYMTIVDRSVETAGTALNEIYEGRTALSQAISRCSYFGPGDWRNVISTQMVEDMGRRPLSNIATKHPELRCFSVVAALLNAKHIDVVGKETHNTPLWEACTSEFKWPIVVHLLDMLKGVPNNRLNDVINGETAFQVAAYSSPGAVIALIKQPGLMPNKRKDDGPTASDLFTTYGREKGKEMVQAALAFVGAVGPSELTDANKNRTVGEYLASKFEWPSQT